MSIQEVKVEAEKFARQVNWEGVTIPTELLGIPVSDAICQRLTENIHAFGGYTALTKALASSTPKRWQEKIEGTKGHALSVDDLLKLTKLFQDPILPALIAHASGGQLVDLSLISQSELSMADLRWSCEHLLSEITLARCQLREHQLNGEDDTACQRQIIVLLCQLKVVLYQMHMALNDSLGTYVNQSKIAKKTK